MQLFISYWQAVFESWILSKESETWLSYASAKLNLWLRRWWTLEKVFIEKEGLWWIERTSNRTAQPCNFCCFFKFLNLNKGAHIYIYIYEECKIYMGETKYACENVHSSFWNFVTFYRPRIEKVKILSNSNTGHENSQSTKWSRFSRKWNLKNFQ